MAYSTWKSLPSGENVLTPLSYSVLVRNIPKTDDLAEFKKARLYLYSEISSNMKYLIIIRFPYLLPI